MSPTYMAGKRFSLANTGLPHSPVGPRNLFLNSKCILNISPRHVLLHILQKILGRKIIVGTQGERAARFTFKLKNPFLTMKVMHVHVAKMRSYEK